MKTVHLIEAQYEVFSFKVLHDRALSDPIPVIAEVTQGFCLLAVVRSSLQDPNFCDPALCADGETHVACKANPGFGKPSGKTIPLDSAKQLLIVKTHNELRNKIATGKQNYTGGFYPEAARMTTIQWDDDLAFIAAANARKCVFNHDTCHNTASYPLAGQNIAFYRYSDGSAKMETVLPSLIEKWYAEYKDCKPAYTKEYPDGYKGPVIGHFTQIVGDRSDRVGCAVVQWTEKARRTFIYLVCNYARGNLIGVPVYTPGKVASQCTTGTNKNYPGLCSTEESVEYGF
ncbi:antigen 5 like allergen Cul n 1-like [Uranotaenia lowii]|uniref:antigen 5 like allergen Cul n 1-like n=1 Tax=Uranotaenia lowii TaxID=190385 RepID=UPI0024797E2D|nr:antigen 5 like allergen Cul n 1-like [Uranotaenia lowii]